MTALGTALLGVAVGDPVRVTQLVLLAVAGGCATAAVVVAGRQAQQLPAEFLRGKRHRRHVGQPVAPPARRRAARPGAPATPPHSPCTGNGGSH